MSIFKDIKITLAPMAGYTDIGFRSLCRKYGCQLTVTEMVSAAALFQHNKVSFDLLRFSPDEKPSALQLFGHDVEILKRVIDYPEVQSFDIIDINMGCPVPKIVKNGDGSALIADPLLAADVVKTVKASGKTVTVKTRLGINERDGVADFVKRMEDAGADAITLHGRTRTEMYRGNADYDAIASAVRVLSIPLYANGDVDSYEKMRTVLDLTGAQGVAVGRAAIGRPWLFRSLLGDNTPVSDEEIVSSIEFHIKSLSFLPERVAVNEMKKHIAFYVKGRRGAKAACLAASHATTPQELIDIAKSVILQPR